VICWCYFWWTRGLMDLKGSRKVFAIVFAIDPHIKLCQHLEIQGLHLTKLIHFVPNMQRGFKRKSCLMETVDWWHRDRYCVIPWPLARWVKNYIMQPFKLQFKKFLKTCIFWNLIQSNQSRFDIYSIQKIKIPIDRKFMMNILWLAVISLHLSSFSLKGMVLVLYEAE